MSRGKTVYYSYEELSLLSPGKVKPAGTLGSHHMLVSQGAGCLCISGSNDGKVELFPGEKLGYRTGTIWKVPNPSSYDDPIRRILAHARINQKALIFTNDPVNYREWWEDAPAGSCADTSRGDRATVLGEYQNNLEFVYDEQHHTITGGDAIIIRSVVDFSTTVKRRRAITRVIVRPMQADKVRVIKWLCEELGIDIADILPQYQAV
jgi:hypothetical protein